MLKTNGKFYIGRLHNPSTGKPADKPLLYDPDDLTTHAVVVGMTGSGKTGLCIDLLEEAALNNIPAIMIDPKGDITNALLHFPDLLPADFQPWINPDQARRDGQSIEEAAAGAASAWAKGLKEWGIDKERIEALKDAAHFAVFTPGSDAGIPVSILASLKAPEISWDGNEELLREKISGVVTAILSLVGFEDIDPLSSREHNLLANIFEQTWSNNKNVEIEELILQVQNPPFTKVGVLDLNTFFPEKDRFSLSVRLNNILAAPTFALWLDGMDFDIEKLLYGSNGKPRHSVFYIAHLNDAERMFFVTLLYSSIETWMRQQQGTSALRAIVYFDEVLGFVPPSSNPPSKKYILRMIKQARAFGIGQILATQNPVDLDYKGLSNAGTWFIGRLQTDQDKRRLLDGLEGASFGGLDRKAFDTLISGLRKRLFLLHNVHQKAPVLFETRWAMNYLAGPLTRNQIPELNELVGAKESLSGIRAKPAKTTSKSKAAARPAAREAGGGAGSATRPALPSGIAEYFLPNNLTLMEAFKAAGESLPKEAMSQGVVYRPALLAQADIRYLDRKYNLDFQQKRTALVMEPDRRGVVRWEDHTTQAVDPNALEANPAPDIGFESLEAPLNDPKVIKSLENDFVDWAFRRSEITVYANTDLKLYVGPPATEGDFRKQVSEEARTQRDAEMKKSQVAFQKKLASLQKKLNKEKRELEADQSEHSQRRLEELGTHLENLFGGTRSRRRVSTSIRSHRLASQSKEDVEESVETIQQLEEEIELLAEEMDTVLDEIEERWGQIASQVKEISAAPRRSDVLLDLFGVAWVPHHIVDIGGKTMELPAFGGQ